MDPFKPVYSDKLVQLFSDKIVLNNYYFPSCKSKVISFIDIESCEVRIASITTGKFRIWGSGDFRSWFPFDPRRSSRGKIYLLRLYSQKIRPAFTVENSVEFENMLRKTKIMFV